MGKGTSDAENAILGQFRANCGLIPFVINRFIDSNIKGQYWDDLMAEGNIGLLKAIERFDPKKGVQFSTFATHVILSRIRRFSISNTNNIRIPEYLHRRLREKDFKPSKPCHLVAKNTRGGFGELSDLNLSDPDTPTGALDSNIFKQIISDISDSLNSVDLKIFEFKIGLNEKKLSLSKISKRLNLKKHDVEKRWKSLLPVIREKLKVCENHI